LELYVFLTVLLLVLDLLMLDLLMLVLVLMLLWLPVASLLVDVDFFTVLRTTQMLFFVDANLLLDVGVAVVGFGSVDGG
jgi:hypothetical protein